jgi:predicted  nucleic acid-binding Zn-ribbon protein
MNANEMADLLVLFDSGRVYEHSQEIATMLRNQEAELDRAVELYTDKAIKVEQLEKELTEAGHMIGVLREYISDLEKGLDSSINLNKAQALRKAQEK